ncbi:MAG: RibD family protein, partial [Bacteroidota bacterium]|nr:RibD family protein [Bacteroidota bacterium]
CIDLNKRFFTFHEKFRPYIILKWAQSANGKIGGTEKKRIIISNDYSNRLVHKWRSEEAAILIGTNTAIEDDPFLTTRLWQGKNPVRIVIDKKLQLPVTLNIFNTEAKTIIYNLVKNSTEGNLAYIKIVHGTSNEENGKFIDQLLHSLFELNIQSVLIEGGSKTLQSFIDRDLWDEARIIINNKLRIKKGVASPELADGALEKQEQYLDDVISYYRNVKG